MIRVAVVGAAGRMGQEVVRTVEAAEDMELVARVDTVPGPGIEHNLAEALDRSAAEVLVDFSHHSAILGNALEALTQRVAPVIGATGASAEDLDEIARACTLHQTPALYAPNFAIGAVLAMRFAEIAAQWMPDVEVIELHHDRKVDAPSGTAMLTAQKIAAARTRAPRDLPAPHFQAEGARGGTVGGVPVHSVRLPGLVAHQEVLFGGPGEILTIRHDSIDRTSFMEGVKLGIRRVRSLSGLTIGLDALLFS